MMHINEMNFGEFYGNYIGMSNVIKNRSLGLSMFFLHFHLPSSVLFDEDLQEEEHMFKIILFKSNGSNTVFWISDIGAKDATECLSTKMSLNDNGYLVTVDKNFHIDPKNYTDEEIIDFTEAMVEYEDFRNICKRMYERMHIKHMWKSA